MEVKFTCAAPVCWCAVFKKLFSESFPSLRKLLLLWPQAPAGGAAFAAQLLLDVWVSGGDLRSLSTGSHSWPLILISSEVEPAGGRNRDWLGGGGRGGHNLLAVQQNAQLPIYISIENMLKIDLNNEDSFTP